jgi:nicotinamidase-related amidase
MSNSAVILIEFQRQWTDPGLYNWLIRKQLDSRNVLGHARKLVLAARELGRPVIHAPLVLDPANRRGWLAHLTLGKVFTKDTPRAEISAGLFEPDDLVVRGRSHFDAFVGSDLEEIIRAGNFDQLFFCGITTEFCVAMTMRTAAGLGFESNLVSDCTVTRNERIQRRVENAFAPNVLSADEVVGRLARISDKAEEEPS